MRKGRWLLVVAALGALALVPALRGDRGGAARDEPGVVADAAEARAPAPTARAAGFTLRDPEGKKVRLRDLRGQVVVLSFWATWCPPCRQEMPHLQALHTKYKEKPVQVLAVNLDQQGSALRKWLTERDLTFTALADTDQAVAGRYGVEGIPTLLVVDQKGQIRHRTEGFDPDMEKDLGGLIDGLLEKK